MRKKTGIGISRMAYDALLAALVVVLGCCAIDLGNNKITLESLPLIVGALLFGPLDGLLIGGIGNFLYQLLRYGFSVTTPLWILPHLVQGVLVGLYARKTEFRPERAGLMGFLIAAELLTTVLNTGVMAADAWIFGYFTVQYVFGTMIIRLAVSAAKGLVYGAVLPGLLKGLRRSCVRKGES